MGTVDDMLDRHEERKKQIERLARALNENKFSGLWPIRTLAGASDYILIATAMLDYMDSLDKE